MATQAAPRSSAAASEPNQDPALPRPVAGVVERPRLFSLLDRGAAGPVTLLSAPAGSGKTVLLSSWLRSAKLPGAVAWVGVERNESDATRFWGMVMDALRRSGAIPDGHPLGTLAPAPLGGQEEFLRRLLEGLEQLPEPMFLVLDDVHHLRSEVALRSLEELLARETVRLHTFLVSRHDPKLGLHRLRLSGGLTEIRAGDLGFTAEEAAELMRAAGITVTDTDLARLHERTEGWAAGLRLAAMSLARHDAPSRFVDEFSGSERTVADYLLSEVLASQPLEVRRLLLRTSILDRVTGPLADALTGRSDGTRMLHQLEEEGGLVVAVDVSRSWFRYHQLLADLLRLELRREEPEQIPVLHRRAARWYADNGHPVDAIRQAELGEDWELAGELLGRHWVHLVMDGEEATLGSLLDGLPDQMTETDAEAATIAAAARLADSRWSEADALLAVGERELAAVPAQRLRRSETAFATVQLLRARRLGDLENAVERAHELLEGDTGPAGAELHTLALMNLGIAEAWTLRLAESEAHLERARALGSRHGRPYVELGCIGALGVVANMTQRLELAEELFREAIALAERVGWQTHPLAGVSYMSLGQVLVDRGRLAEGEGWLERARPILEDGAEPAASVALRHAQGMLEFCRGRFSDALAAFREGEQLSDQLRTPHFLAPVERQWQLRSQLALGDLEPVRAALDQAPAAGLRDAEWCNLEARLRLATDDAQGAADAVAPVLSGEAYAFHPNREIEALLLDGLARNRLEDIDAVERSVERALELAEPQGRVWIFLTVPDVGDLLEAHPVHRTAHASHLKALLDHAAGVEPSPDAAREELREPLSDRELAVLRFLPTNLPAGEIAGELFLSVHTVKTHMRKLYAKLDVHTRAEAVQRGRALGLLAPGRRSS